MKNSFWPWLALILGGISLASWILQTNLCEGCVPPGSKKTTSEVIAPTAKTAKVAAATGLGAWSFGDGNGLKLNIADHFRFNKSSFNHLDRSEALDEAMTKTAAYLKANPDRSLNVTGYYKSDEKNPSVLPNLGLARANDISKHLTSLGVPAAQISTNAKLLTKDWWDGNILKKGIDFSFDKVVAATGRIDDIKNRLFGKPLTLYFATNQDKINLSSQQRKDFADLIYYIDNVKGSKLDVSGHTDNVGDRDYNVNLSNERAKFAARYLTKNGGVGAKQMTTKGFGPDKPVASNKTSDGRAKNRRVEVTLR